MTEFGFKMDAPVPHRHRVWPFAIAVPLVLVVLVWFAAQRFAPAADYTGAGSGEVTITISKGDTLRQIGSTLQDAGVIASVDAWLAVVQVDEAAGSIGPGDYQLRSRMSAREALNLLLDPTARAAKKLVVKEGMRLADIVDAAAEVSGIARDEFVAALKRPKSINLPAAAKGHPEGFFFPATYEINSDDNATTILSKMTARWEQAAKSLELSRRAAAAGHTVLEIMTIASILEVESAPGDYAKVARVIENRLKLPMRLQLDSTVNYALGISKLQLSAEQMNVDSDYNTYKVDGLPPGPIGNPGEAAIEAALEPARGKWLYFVTVDPDKRITKFAITYDEFLALKQEFLNNA